MRRSRVNIMLGRSFGGASVGFSGVIILHFFLAGFRLSSPAALPVALFFMFLIAILFTALGTAIASVLEDMQGFS